jgi:outer membrane protein assembly factor BamB
LSAAGAADWPGWQGPNRDGKSTETGLLKSWPAGGPELLWKVTDIGKGFSTVAAVKDVVYATGDVGDNLTIFAFDMKGQPKWKVVQGPAVKVDRPGSRSNPVIDDGKFYLIGAEGLVTCHDVADGKPVWKRELKEMGGASGRWGYSESVLILDKMAVVTPGGKNALVALDKATGKDIWRSDAQANAHYSSAVVLKEKDSTIIVQGSGSGIFAVDAKDGKKVWSNGFCTGNTANCPDPAYADGYLFWANGYGKGGICFKVDYKDGKWTFTEAWQTKDMVCHHGGYVIEKGYIYGNHNAGWSCLDLKTGEAKWKDQKGVGKGSVCFADGMLYLFGEAGGQAGLAAASPEAFKMSGEFKVAGAGPSWAHPVVADGKLFLRYDTNLYCFNVKAK